MSNSALWVRARKQIAPDENVRLSTDRECLLALAPRKWEELKAAFRRECEVISAQSDRARLECNEPDDHTLNVNRALPAHGYLVTILTLRFHPIVPCIVWQDWKNAKPPESLGMTIDGSNVFFVEGRSGIVISESGAQFIVRMVMPEFAAQRIMRRVMPEIVSQRITS